MKAILIMAGILALLYMAVVLGAAINYDRLKSKNIVINSLITPIITVKCMRVLLKEKIKDKRSILKKFLLVTRYTIVYMVNCPMYIYITCCSVVKIQREAYAREVKKSPFRFMPIFSNNGYRQRCYRTIDTAFDEVSTQELRYC